MGRRRVPEEANTATTTLVTNAAAPTRTIRETRHCPTSAYPPVKITK
ncbi:MAG TPA: hypothetical protein VFX60_17705 [Micromonospora sp.]|nr:hypothetical protein [Micromonospora sp.]